MDQASVKLLAEVMAWKVDECILAMSLASELGQDSHHWCMVVELLTAEHTLL